MEIPTGALIYKTYDCSVPVNDMNGLTSAGASRTNWQITDEMKEDCFRVSVCLKQYFSDERSRAYVNVIRRLPVSWLQQRLRTLFGLQGSFCLCSRGHLLPSDEQLSVLQPDDPVQVIPLTERTLEWSEKGQKFNAKGTLHENQSNLHPKNLTEIQTATLTRETDKEELLRMKEKALAILDTCDSVTSNAEISTGPVPSASGGSDKLRPTRRRVRRRKRRFSDEDSSGRYIQDKHVTNVDKDLQTNELQTSTQSYAKFPSMAQKSSSVKEVTLEIAESKNTTERDTSAGPRRPRLVHSLPPSHGQISCTNVP